MSKKIFVSVISLLIVVGVFIIMCNLSKIGDDEENVLSINENSFEISNFEEVTDDCVIEAKLQNAIEEASNNLGEDNTKYLVKNVDGYIYVYYVSADSEEYLYKRTTISVDYLSQEDIDNLDEGIEAVGVKELNRILEDFE